MERPRDSWGEVREIWAGTGGFSYESEHDLAIMVRDFLESGSIEAESWCSSDSDSGLLDVTHCAKGINFLRHSADQLESNLLATTRSLILSLGDVIDLQNFKISPCNCSCIRWSLVKLLRLSGYDAGLCISKWMGSGKVPGGDHAYIDVLPRGNTGSSERMIIDIDFRSHFEIARAVESYDAMLNSLPVVYVGTLSKLKQFLQIMVEAAKSSLKQNSMPFPPWRSLAYLQSKWQSAYERKLHPNETIVGNLYFDHSQCMEPNETIVGNLYFDHSQCMEHLRRLKASLQTETEVDRLFKPIINDCNWKAKIDGRRRPVYGS